MIAQPLPAFVRLVDERVVDARHGRVRLRTGDRPAFEEVGGVRQQLATLDALGLPAFACDAFGTAKAMNGAAQAMLGHAIAVREGKLELADKMARTQLQRALAQRRGGPPVAILVAPTKADGDVVVLDVVPAAGGMALVVCRKPRIDDLQSTHLLRASFDLTQAEADVALRMARAERLQTIASDRGVSEGTVRCQSKVIFAKLGVSTQAQLVRKLRAVAG